MEPTILFEDANVVVIDKPSGMQVHRDSFSKPGDFTVADWHVSRVPEACDVGEPMKEKDGTLIARPGIVHRLDIETSGVLVLAKNQEAFLHLKAQFHDRIAKKEYRAVVYGKMKDLTGMIDRPIGRSASDFRLRSAQRGARGLLRPAVTRFERMGYTDTHSYVRLMPETGRTHQLRVHLKAINHPIVCDKLYAPNHPCDCGFTRLALHAYLLTLQLPGGEERTFEASLPTEFVHATEGFSA
jgi:23S rRNA pseudouridine1911/1915/1917 synthase